MILYLHYNRNELSNSYLVAQEGGHQCLLVNLGSIDTPLLETIENNNLVPVAVLVTSNEAFHVRAIETFMKIYDPVIYASDHEIAGLQTEVPSRTFEIAGCQVEALHVPAHRSDAFVYRIGNMIFPGDAIGAGTLPDAANGYAHAVLLEELEREVLSAFPPDDLVLPSFGPPSRVEAELLANPYFTSRSIDFRITEREPSLSPATGMGSAMWRL